MKKILYLALIFLTFYCHKINAQQFKNYNLYIQNGFLYNPAYTMQNKFSAFLNVHNQWIGFDGAPEINTLGIFGPITKNMGLGLSVVSQKYGVMSNFNGKVNYAYKAKFSDLNYLIFGTAMGVSKNNINSDALTADVNLSDPLILGETYNQTSLSASAGLSYFLNDFEFQFILPQIYEQNAMNFYSIGILSYSINLNNNALKIKPSVLVRGTKTTPKQFETNLMAEFNNLLWIQAGYRSNNSIIFSGGINFINFNLGYAYQIDNNIIGNVSNGNHEIQLIFNFGEKWYENQTTSKIKGEVTNKITNEPIVADVIFYNQNKKDSVRTDENGKYKTQLPFDKTYDLEIKSSDYTSFNQNFEITSKDKNKTIDALLMPKYTTLNGTSNIPNAEIKIYMQIDTLVNSNFVKLYGQNDSLVYTGFTDENGNYKIKLEPGKNYKIEVVAEGYISDIKNIVMPIDKMALEKEIKLKAIINVNGKVVNVENQEKIVSILRITKDSTVIINKAVNGSFETKLEEGEYIFEAYGSNIISHKEKVILNAEPKEIDLELIVILVAEDRTFKLGNVEYKTGKAVLTEESYIVLDELVRLLNNNPTLKIEIGGHTDNVGSDLDNQKISQDRADACKKYIVSKGIDDKRVVSIGYGELVPLLPNTNATNKAKNRRTEFKIID